MSGRLADLPTQVLEDIWRDLHAHGEGRTDNILIEKPDGSDIVITPGEVREELARRTGGRLDS